MSGKLKPNFTPVPNVILDEIMRGLNEGEFKTLMAICRYTYGWGKQSDRISLNQLAEITGMDRSNVARARRRLGNLVEVTPGTATTASMYRLNIEISDVELKAVAAKGSDPSATSDRSAASVKGSDPSATFQRKPKKERSSAVRKKRDHASPSSTDPRIQSLLSSFIRKYVDRVGTSYVVVSGKDPALLKRLLSAGHGVEAIETAMDRYFADSFYGSKTGFDVGGFAKVYNRLNSVGSKKKHDYEKDAFPTL